MYAFTTISRYHQDLLAGKVTCLAVVQSAFAAIQKDQHLNAWVHLFEAEAIAHAKQCDAAIQNGLTTLPALFGVTIGVKDVICIKGKPVSAASKMLAHYNSAYSATAIERLVSEGAILLGTLNCDEFAMGSSNENSVYGPARNGIDANLVAGGSSGGSAVAVQQNHCMLSLGSDTGGSVRQPADFCGVIGLKPSYGRISRYGLIAYASSFDQIGIFGRTITDVALLLSIMAGADDFDSTVSPAIVPNYVTECQTTRPLQLGYWPEALAHPALDPAIKAAIENQLKAAEAAGHTVIPVSFPYLDYLVPTYYILTTAEASSNLGRYDGVRYGHRSTLPSKQLHEFYKKNRSEGFGPEVQKRILLGTFVLSAGYFDAYFTKAQQVRRLLRDATDATFQQVDALIMPTVPTPAFAIGEKTDDPISMYLADIFTVYPNLVGCPAISLPLFQHPTGKPFGIQIMTNRFDEVTLLQLSEEWMKAKG